MSNNWKKVNYIFRYPQWPTEHFLYVCTKNIDKKLYALGVRCNTCKKGKNSKHYSTLEFIVVDIHADWFKHHSETLYVVGGEASAGISDARLGWDNPMFKSP